MQSKLDRIKEILKEKLNEGLSTDKELENLINNQIKNANLYTRLKPSSTEHKTFL